MWCYEKWWGKPHLKEGLTDINTTAVSAGSNSKNNMINHIIKAFNAMESWKKHNTYQYLCKLISAPCAGTTAMKTRCISIISQELFIYSKLNNTEDCIKEIPFFYMAFMALCGITKNTFSNYTNFFKTTSLWKICGANIMYVQLKEDEPLEP